MKSPTLRVPSPWKSLFFALLVSATVAGCGEKGTDSSGKGDESVPAFDEGQALTADGEPDPDAISGVCGENVAADYRVLLDACSEILSEEQADECTSKAKEFLENYDGVDCTAELTVSLTGETESAQITEDQVRWLKNAASSLEF